MGNKINITSSGTGPISIGNIVQGNRNRVDNMASSTVIDGALARAQADVARLAPVGPHQAEAATKVAEHLQALGTEAKQPNRSEQKGATILRTIRENFSWAYPVVKDLAHVIWPTLLSLL